MSRRIKIWSFADVDRSGKVRWTANELGYEVEEMRVRPGTLAEDPYPQLNPYEQIPAAELEGEILIESTAICLGNLERYLQSLIARPAAQAARFFDSLET